MTIHLDPARIRQGWTHATAARGEIGDARNQVGTARGSDLDDLQTTLTDASNDMDGVLEVVQGVLDAFGTNVDECITTYGLTDGRSDGHFHELAR
jgi:hypothetical protein